MAVAKDHELVVHVRVDLDERVLLGGEYAEQFHLGALEVGVVGTGGEHHLAPVDQALHVHAAGLGVQEMVHEVGVVDTVYADLDRLGPLGVGGAVPNHLVDTLVEVAFRVEGVVGRALGELGGELEGIEVAVVPVGIALERGGVDLAGAIGVEPGAAAVDGGPHGIPGAQAGALDQHVVVLGRNRGAVEMHDVGELHHGHRPQ